MISAAKNTDDVIEEEEDDRVECPGCGRMFNEQAADRHIKACQARNKNKPARK